MDFSVTNGLTDTLSALRQARAAQTYVSPPRPRLRAEETANLPVPVFSGGRQGGTQLRSESREDLDGGGYRLSRTFEKEDGRIFTKIEEFALTERGARRSVWQQNPSGSVTLYEEVLDRESGGNFRRTQRFQNAGGEVATAVTTGFKVTDSFILTGGQATYAVTPLPFAAARGTRLDLSA